MVLNKVFDTMAVYDSGRKKASEDYTAARKQIQANYGDSKVGREKLAELKASYDAARKQAENNGLAVVKEVFDDLEKKINDAITAPVPADFPATLEAVKATGSALSASEAELYIQKYCGNYTAYRSLVSLFDGLKVCKVFPVTYDHIMHDFNRFRAYAEGFFSNSIGGYMASLFLSENNPMRVFDAGISSFLNDGNILEYGKAVAESESDSE